MRRGLPHRFQMLLPCLLALLPFAQSHADAAGFRLSVRPSICVSYDSDSPCTMAILLSWESSSTADVCLQQAEQQNPLRCWEQARAGELRLDYSDTADVRYRLLEAASREVLAETDVVVINRDLRDSRTRRRHVWSIL